MLFTALQLVASVARGGRLLFCLILFCHWWSPVDLLSARLPNQQTPTCRSSIKRFDAWKRLSLFNLKA
jgi:hypothetical protein